MIPHAASALATTVGALVVAVVSETLGTFPVCATCLPGGQLASLLPAGDGAVDMPVVTPTVDQKQDLALLALADADFQMTSTRSKNWTPSPSGHILCLPVCVAHTRCP
jgi:hypothetical protein